jgi:hypothetical protein
MRARQRDAEYGFVVYSPSRARLLLVEYNRQEVRLVDSDRSVGIVQVALPPGSHSLLIAYENDEGHIRAVLREQTTVGTWGAVGDGACPGRSKFSALTAMIDPSWISVEEVHR